MSKTYIRTFIPNPAAVKRREKLVALAIERAGKSWRLHPDNYITREKHARCLVALNGGKS